MNIETIEVFNDNLNIIFLNYVYVLTGCVTVSDNLG